jgi:hypothetical protein
VLTVAADKLTDERKSLEAGAAARGGGAAARRRGEAARRRGGLIKPPYLYLSSKAS